jgi:hypothetical protein
MPKREVNLGLIAYEPTAHPGLTIWGRLGETVDVHEGDLERFDRLNGAPGEAPEGSANGAPSEAPEGSANGDPGEAPEVPAGNASQVAWREYALASGASEADVEGLTRDELRERFGPKE